MRSLLRRTGLAFSAAAALTCAAAAESRAANLLELNFWMSGPRYDAVVPLCDESFPLITIQEDFATKESRFWNSPLTIVGFQGVHEVSFMPWASGTIPRRFCTGKVLTSDGHYRPIHYSITENTGFAGASSGVDWCVTGLDRNWTYNPACRMAKP
ncbi:hypothetical protein A33M_3721 [Rhodovulum sp. PH10]|uniref:hypothetical protein n=1 Tax=Rhodovulum sp. PH10 TaxID=1187851 RepID=UPI00027C1E85|nr:hypothetical protein [Rhodovulum sp. PH10]EJW10980.1 hypothetical protein A33M_3721 [Rhodovulum sp. PH10]